MSYMMCFLIPGQVTSLLALYAVSCHCFLPVFSTVNQNESDSAARRSIRACCDTDTIVAAQLFRISPIREVKQFGQLPLSKAQAAVQQSAAQILLHAFSSEFPDQAYRYHSASFTSVIRLVQLFLTVTNNYKAPKINK